MTMPDRCQGLPRFRVYCSRRGYSDGDKWWVKEQRYSDSLHHGPFATYRDAVLAKTLAESFQARIDALDERVFDPDYSPAFQDEYQRLWHEAAQRLAEIRTRIEALPRYGRQNDFGYLFRSDVLALLEGLEHANERPR